jgi:hypothetical protein
MGSQCRRSSLAGIVLASTVLIKAAKPELAQAIAPQVRFTDLLLRGDGDVRSGAASMDENTRQIVQRIVISNSDGNFSDPHRQYLQTVITRHTNLPPSEALSRLDQVSAEMKSEADNKKDVGNRARKIGVILGFFTSRRS